MTRHNGLPFDDAADAAHARLREQLDAWRLAPVPDDLDALGAELARRAPATRRRAARRPASRAALVAVAAAAAAFLVLAALGARVEREGGRVALSLALPWASAQPAAPGRDVEVARVAEAAARRATAVALANFLEAHAAGLQAREAADQERLARLAVAVDGALARERVHTARLVDALRRGATTEDRRTRAAVAELAAFVQEEGR